MNLLGSGQVVKITAKHHRYYGEEAVVQYSTSKMYRIRLLNREKALCQRFGGFSDGKLYRVLSPQITMNIKRTSITPIKGKKAKSLLNEWQPETLKVLDKYEGKTKKQIEAMIGHKLTTFKC